MEYHRRGWVLNSLTASFSAGGIGWNRISLPVEELAAGIREPNLNQAVIAGAAFRTLLGSAIVCKRNISMGFTVKVGATARNIEGLWETSCPKKRSGERRLPHIIVDHEFRGGVFDEGNPVEWSECVYCCLWISRGSGLFGPILLKSVFEIRFKR